jgi:hypothetical protein
LRKGWAMRPATRAAIIDAGVFWGVLHRSGVAELIGLGATNDLIVEGRDVSSTPVSLPPAAQAERAGDFLRIRIGEQELLVPGGVSLAPVGTPAVDATTWESADEERQLADFDHLLKGSHTSLAYAQPVLRRRLTETITALANRRRWSDVVQLTEGVSPTAEYVPPAVFFLRSAALERLQREADATHLLIQVAGSKSLERKHDARTIEQLAGMLAAHDLYDAAVVLYNRALKIQPNASIDDRVREILMNKRLEQRYESYKTAHFDIHYPHDAGLAAAQQLGTVLERELQRLQSWIPVPSFKPVVVNALTWEDFRSTYTGSDFILGFYNGKITVPVAGIDVEIPEITNILAHELSHAMIAQATNNQAPHWFQEGFAQRIEERPYHANAFNMFDNSKLLPISLLDQVITSSPDPEMIGAAYVVSQTDIRYIEARYGRAGLQKLLTAFASGATTSDAIQRLSGATMPDFEKQLRAWGQSEQRVFYNSKS